MSEKYERSPLKLWSPLQRLLAASRQTKGSSQQWTGIVRNLQKKGVSGVEVDWSEIMLFLEDYPYPVLHIDELLAFLAEKSPCELVLQHHITDEYAPRVHFEKQDKPSILPSTEIRHGRREVRLLHFMDRTFGLCIWLHVQEDMELFGRHRYWSFSVPRGRKKIAPYSVRRDFISAKEAMAYGRVLIGRMARRLAKEGFVGQAKSLNRFTPYALPGGEHYTEWLITAPNLAVTYRGEHFDIPNIVAHVRTTERMTPQGVRLFVLEEIQSDWNQALRKAVQEGRERTPVVAEDNDIIEWDDDMEPPPFNPYLNHWVEAALRMMLLLAANQGFAGIAWLPGSFHAERFPWANAEGLKAFYDHIVPAAAEKLAKSWGVRLGTSQFSTLSRHFRLGKLAEKTTWQVLSRDSGKVVGEEFSNYAAAETFRKSMEDVVLEAVSILPISDDMRADICTVGLPYLGAVGQRPVKMIK